MFKQFLETNEGFEHHYPYLWQELSKFAMESLKESTSINNSKLLLAKIADLQPVIAELKND